MNFERGEEQQETRERAAEWDREARFPWWDVPDS